MTLAYTITALTAASHLVSDKDDHALGINTAGHVVGGYRCGERTQAFIYDGTRIHDVVLTVGGTSEACAINDAGQIVGSYRPETATYTTAFFHDGTTTHLFDEPESTALAINTRGQILVQTASSHTCLWADGAMTPIGTLGGARIQASGLNRHGWVVGWSQRDDRAGRAFLYRNAVSYDLGCLAIPTARRQGSNAYAINDHGHVVGFSGASNGFGHAVLFAGEQIHDLGAPNGMRSTARAINNANQIVGYAYTYPLQHTVEHSVRALLWQNQTLVELNEVISEPDWVLKNAVGINDRGQIVGWGTLHGVLRVFLLTPVSDASRDATD